MATNVEKKKQTGTYRPSIDGNKIEMNIVSEIPEPPSYLSERALEIYYKYASVLLNEQLLTEFDTEGLAMMADLMSLYEISENRLDKINYLKAITPFMRDYGFTLKSRANLRVDKTPKKEANKSALRRRFSK